MNTKNIFWLASYPKSGNTWLRALLTNYQSREDIPADINALDAAPIGTDRYLFDEIIGLSSSDMRPAEIEYYRPRFYREISSADQPLFIKVHDAYTYNTSGEALFPADITAGVIYLIRNPLDIAVSYANHADKPIDEIIKWMASDSHGFDLERDRIHHSLPVKLRSWSAHVLSWVNASEIDFHLVRYEDLLVDPYKAFSEILSFAGLDLDEERLEKAVCFSSFKTLQMQEKENHFVEKQPTAKSFFRQGMANSWQNELSRAQINGIISEHHQVMKRFGYLTTTEDYSL